MNEHAQIIARLADRAAARLSPAEAARLQCHLENCSQCREQARRFSQSYAVLENALEGMIAPPLLNGVLARLEHPENNRVSLGWRPAWAGAAVLVLVLVFSAWMSRPGLSTQQVLQEYSEDVQTLSEGGAVESDGAWLSDSWNETTGLESFGDNLESNI